VSNTVPVVGAAVIIGLAGVLYATTRNNDLRIASDRAIEDSAAREDQLGNLANSDQSNKLAVQPIETTVIEADAEDSALATNASDGIADTERSANGSSISEAIGFAQSMARERLNDASLNEYANTLRNDPGKLAAVLDEFSAEADSERLSRLRLVLGQLDDPSMVSVAESMVFSGNPESSKEALRLLRDIGQDVPAAQDVGVNLLTSTQDPKILVSATNILTNGASADAETTQRVVTSLTSLVQHPDAAVRRASFSTLARWSKDPSDTATLLQGLDDVDPAVRRSTAYGFVGYANADASVISALLNTASNQAENVRVRKGAIRALKGMTLDDSQTARMQAAQSQL